jgi:hypothetical protein
MTTTLICGPIIGHVSENTANILLEFDTDIDKLEVCITDLSVNNEKESYNNQLSFRANHPRVHTISKLEPGHSYRFIITDKRIAEPYSASFRTPLKDIIELDVIALSGWSEEIGDKIINAARSAQVILHCGNLVSTHNLFAELSARDVVPSSKEVEDELRLLYRRVLMRPKLRKLLANNSNLAIWGDEESLNWEGAETVLDNIKFSWKIAHSVYREYLRALFDNDDSPYNELKPREFYSVSIGQTAIVVIDTHGNRMPNFQLNRSIPFLGNRQRKMLKDLSKKNPANMIFLSDIPFITIANVNIDIGKKESLEEQWPSQDNDMKEIFGFAHSHYHDHGRTVILQAGGGECGFTSIIEHDNCAMYQSVVGRLDSKMVPLNIPSVIHYKNWTIMHRENTMPSWSHISLVKNNGHICGSVRLEDGETTIRKAQQIGLEHTNKIENSDLTGLQIVENNDENTKNILVDIPNPDNHEQDDNEIDNEYRQLLDEVSTFNPSLSERMPLNDATDGTATDGMAQDNIESAATIIETSPIDKLGPNKGLNNEPFRRLRLA